MFWLLHENNTVKKFLHENRLHVRYFDLHNTIYMHEKSQFFRIFSFDFLGNRVRM